MVTERLKSKGYEGKNFVDRDILYPPLAKYKLYCDYSVLLYKMGNYYCLYFGKHLEEWSIGRFTDPDIIPTLFDSKIVNFKETAINVWRLGQCCNILGRCVASDKDISKWYSLFMLYVLLKLTPEVVEKIKWTVLGFEGLYKWSRDNRLVESIKELSFKSDCFRNCYVDDGLSEHFGKLFNPAKWLSAGISNLMFEKILKGYGEMAYVNLMGKGIDLFSGSITTLPLVWDMRSLRKVYKNNIKADWYIVGVHDNCMLYWTDFMWLIIDRKEEFMKSDKTVNTINVRVVTDPSAEKQFDRICEIVGTDINYCDMPPKDVSKVECDNGSALIWLPVCLTEYFEDVYSYGGDDYAGVLDIDKYMKARENVLEIMSPGNEIYHSAEKDIAVTGFYRYDGKIYCETSLGLIKLPDDTQGESRCKLIEEWWGSRKLIQKVLSKYKTSVNATLEDMVTMKANNQLPWVY